jgi:protease IV
MALRPWMALALLPGAGCVHPLRTDSKVQLNAAVRVDLPSNSNEQPVEAMPVDGQGCGGPRVAILDVDGLLLNTNLVGPYSSGDNPIDLFREKLDAAACADVVAVVLRINSPGGSVTATDVMWGELMRFKEKTGKPVIACLMDLGTGGAYYLATGCDAVVAHPTTVTGGLGVLLNLYNFNGTLQLAKVEYQTLTAKKSPRIDLSYRIGVLQEEDKQLLVGLADQFHERLKSVVRQRRPQVKEDEATFDGRVFSARQALDLGLIDRVGYLPDALELARQCAGSPHAGAAVLHRRHDVARTPFATTPNVPLQASLLPVSLPGADRSRLPAFLYLWQPDPSIERLSGK